MSRRPLFTVPIAFICISILLGAEHAYAGMGEGTYYSQPTYYSQGAYYSQSTYYSQGSYQTVFSRAATAAKSFTIGGFVTKGSGTFFIDDPIDPKNKILFHSFVESPAALDLYDGVATVDSKGEARVQLPDYFMALNQDFRYLFTSLGAPQPNLYLKNKIYNNSFSIAGGVPGGRVSWQVTGVRHDPYILAHPIPTETLKGLDTLADPGTFLHPGIYTESMLGPVSDFLRRLFSFWN